ncbi:TonB-dependent receptor [Hyphococcus flavus]|uniref:TonB-dependent receptor n=1 Tax=Hyphococcus flavus TaxID=1866326 RepID=A0AAE9ZB34_9PROT|nr:TonB-dependent receptor [Hyphococcus flavus]WDI31204.1 TonB-dependent receptor [Hyphococcus flavus]
MKNYLLLSSAATLTMFCSNSVHAQDEPFDKEEDRIVVTASPIERTVGETIISTSVVSGEDLQRRLENSIGETLRREPGISSTYFGPGASRPVIRGLTGDRIRVLDAGIGSIDASATSPDHAAAVEPATAEKIEIVRGSAMLLYGSSAAGGVVNIFNGRIPSQEPEGGIDGALRVGGSTVDNGVEASGGFDLKLGDLGGAALVFHGDGFYRDADDYDIPGFAESERLRALEEAEEDHEDEEDHDHEEEEEVFGTAENSAYETKGGSAGLSLIFDNGFFGISGTAMDTNYGVPGGHGHGHEHEDEEDEDHDEEDHDEEEHGEEEEGGVTIDLRQRRLDLNGEVEGDFGLFRKAKIRFGYADYEHAEIEPSGEIGTLFTNEGWEGRFELVDKPFNALGGEVNGALGLQYRKRDFSAVGEEAFVPPTNTNQLGVFALKELSVGQWRFELGGRYENTNHEVEETGFEREFNGLSVSGGIGYQATDSFFMGVTGFRTERAPSTEELFSNGPHLATNAFEIGDPTLDEEVATGVEATARVNTDRFTFSVSGYYTSYDDFIYEAATGMEEDELPVFQFFANDATFRGFEAQAAGELFRAGTFDIHADASVDLVKGTIDVTGNDNLPRIPPLSGIIGLEARSAFADVRAELEYAGSQDDVTDFELPTDGYQVFNAFLTLRPFSNQPRVSLRLSGNNLTDEEVRLHTSFLKDLTPLPGRNVKFSIRGEF